MGGMSYPQDTNNQNSQKSLADVRDDLNIILDKLGLLIQDMVDQCECSVPTPKEKEGCSCC